MYLIDTSACVVGATPTLRLNAFYRDVGVAPTYFLSDLYGKNLTDTFAQAAIEYNLILLHSDKDFMHIAGVNPLLQLFSV